MRRAKAVYSPCIHDATQASMCACVYCPPTSQSFMNMYVRSWPVNQASLLGVCMGVQQEAMDGEALFLEAPVLLIAWKLRNTPRRKEIFPSVVGMLERAMCWVDLFPGWAVVTEVGRIMRTNNLWPGKPDLGK